MAGVVQEAPEGAHHLCHLGFRSPVAQRRGCRRGSKGRSKASRPYPKWLPGLLSRWCLMVSRRGQPSRLRCHKTDTCCLICCMIKQTSMCLVDGWIQAPQAPQLKHAPVWQRWPSFSGRGESRKYVAATAAPDGRSLRSARDAQCAGHGNRDLREGVPLLQLQLLARTTLTSLRGNLHHELIAGRRQLAAGGLSAPQSTLARMLSRQSYLTARCPTHELVVLADFS